MQLKFTAQLILLACLVSSLRAKALRRRECYECEEELWEEVPCDKTPSNNTSITPKPITPTNIPKPTTYQPAKPALSPYTSSPPPLTTSHPTTDSPEYTTPKDPYKKCYFECKLGCREFCRKVVSNPYDKKIVQVSKISEPTDKGHIQSTHILQRQLIPKTVKTYNNYEPSDHSRQIVASVEPVYGPYEVGESDVKNIKSLHSYPPYYTPPSSDAYSFPIPFEKVFSRLTKASLDPVQSVQISLDAPSGKISSSSSSSSYSSPTPVKETSTNLDNLDDSIDSFIREFMGHNTANQVHSKPFYSVSYNRL